MKRITSIEPYLATTHNELYETIAEVFGAMLPLFKRCGAFGEQTEGACDLQVVVKAQSYTMPPKSDYEGVWHVEGIEAEHIKVLLLIFVY